MLPSIEFVLHLQVLLLEFLLHLLDAFETALRLLLGDHLQTLVLRFSLRRRQIFHEVGRQTYFGLILHWGHSWWCNVVLVEDLALRIEC